MPSILYFGQGGADWTKDYPPDPRAPVVFYLLPPIRYPDGKIPVSCSLYNSTATQVPILRKNHPWFCCYGLSITIHVPLLFEALIQYYLLIVYFLPPRLKIFHHMEMSPLHMNEVLQNLSRSSALMVFEQGGIFIVPHLL